MTKVFGWTSTTDEVLEGIDLSGKRVLVTGVSAGLGVETARALAAHGADVVGAARDLAKAWKATSGIPRLQLVELDLASFASVRACADKLRNDDRRFDLVIANAGVMAAPSGKTADGFETQFGTNHLGHFLFINRILPLVKDGGRIVIVASSAHRIADVSLDDPNFEKTEYDAWAAYGRSKTANILFATELDRRLRGRRIRVVAVHPGGIKTELGRNIGHETMDAMVIQLNAELARAGKAPFEWKTIPQGAATQVWAGVVASGDEVGGHYCENCHLSPIKEGELAMEEEGMRPYAIDPERARALWAKSEELVGEKF